MLVWAGKLRPGAEAKAGTDVTSSDYLERTTISFMSWTDVAGYFENQVYEILVARLIATAKRHERPQDPPSQT